MSPKNLYLLLVAVGSIVPYLFFGSFFSNNAGDLAGFASALFVNGAAGGFSADVLISSFVLWFWSFGDARRLGVARWWIIPIVNLLIGLSAALPLYLYLRYEKAATPPTLAT